MKSKFDKVLRVSVLTYQGLGPVQMERFKLGEAFDTAHVGVVTADGQGQKWITCSWCFSAFFPI